MTAITDLATLAAADVVDADWLVVHDLSAETDKKIAQSALLGLNLPGIADGSIDGRLYIRNVSALADAGLSNLASLFGASTTLNGILLVHDANSAYSALFVLRGGINAVVEALDPSSQFSTTPGATGSNVIYSGGYYLENKTTAACSYYVLFFGSLG